MGWGGRGIKGCPIKILGREKTKSDTRFENARGRGEERRCVRKGWATGKDLTDPSPSEKSPKQKQAKKGGKILKNHRTEKNGRTHRGEVSMFPSLDFWG